MRMILIFTEEQKKEIEARGMTVIEFKRRLHNMGKTIDDALQILKEVTDKVTSAWNMFVKNFLEAVDGVQLVFEQIREAYHYPTSLRYRIVKTFSKCTGTDIRVNWKNIWKIKRWIIRCYC